MTAVLFQNWPATKVYLDKMLGKVKACEHAQECFNTLVHQNNLDVTPEILVNLFRNQVFLRDPRNLGLQKEEALHAATFFAKLNPQQPIYYKCLEKLVHNHFPSTPLPLHDFKGERQSHKAVDKEQGYFQ